VLNQIAMCTKESFHSQVICFKTLQRYA
jgi:hypothetical protein